HRALARPQSRRGQPRLSHQRLRLRNRRNGGLAHESTADSPSGDQLPAARSIVVAGSPLRGLPFRPCPGERRGPRGDAPDSSPPSGIRAHGEGVLRAASPPSPEYSFHPATAPRRGAAGGAVAPRPPCREGVPAAGRTDRKSVV